jgi:hypothetical protein
MLLRDTRLTPTGRHLFFPLSLASLRSDSRSQNAVPWYWSMSASAQDGTVGALLFVFLADYVQDCCSRYWISARFVENMPHMHALVTRGYEGNGYLPTEIAKLHRAKGKSLDCRCCLCSHECRPGCQVCAAGLPPVERQGHQ